VVWLENEKQMDIVTALSGCGPAYFLLVMESLQQAAEKLGLPTDIAHLLTLQTAFGTARMAQESEETTIELRQRVTSLGGTTEQAIRVLEEKNLRGVLSEALNAAKNRSEELAKTLATAEKK
jgi:pyrroline-5-carboxylate reductase